MSRSAGCARRWYRSTDMGATWEPCEVSDRSPLAAVFKPLAPGEVHGDGYSLYLYEVSTQPEDRS